jgi:type II secretory pathway component PulF
MGYPKCPGYVPAAIEAAEAVNQVPQTVAAIEAELVAKQRADRAFQPIHPLYPIFVLGVLMWVILSLCVFILPKFRAVFEEQHSALPAPTTWLIDIAEIFYGTPLLFLLLLLFVGLTILVIVKKFRCRRPENLSFWSKAADRLKWNLPLLRRIEWNYSMARLLNIIRLALISGRTVNEAIDAAMKLDVNWCIHRRLSRWRDKVEAGQNVSQAARQCGLGQSLAWAFDTSIHDGCDTPAILENVEEFHRNSYRGRVAVARQVLWPCVVLCLALGVGFVVYALFLPMINMIYTSMGETMP